MLQEGRCASRLTKPGVAIYFLAKLFSGKVVQWPHHMRKDFVPSLGAFELMVSAYKVCFIAMIQIYEMLAELSL